MSSDMNANQHTQSQGAIARQGSSYRQGLVLGLTMAEVMLLIVFALLLTLGSALISKRDQVAKLSAIEALLRENGDLLNVSATELRLIAKLKLRYPRLSNDDVEKIIIKAEAPEPSLVLTAEEESFIKSARQSISAFKSKEIDDFWDNLKSTTQKAKAISQQLALAASLSDIVELPLTQKEIVELLKIGAEAKSKGDHNWPPIIRLSEADGYYFKTGSAELSEGFSKKLQTDIIPTLIRYVKEYKVDVIEVIGHTDEQAIAPRASNFDVTLVDVAKGIKPVSTLIPGDNAGLGLARAVAVVRAFLTNREIQKFQVLPLSGAQLIDVNEHLTSGGKTNVKERRRIEIRLRRTQPIQAKASEQAR